MEEESKELKEKLTEVEQLLRQTEVQRQELERQNQEQVMAIGLAATKVSLKHFFRIPATKVQKIEPARTQGDIF